MKKIFLFISVLSLCSVCSAAIITVDDDGPADFNSIQAAIDDANNGDTIIVSPGTYNENISICGKDIILRSTNAEDRNVVAATVIEGVGIFPSPDNSVVTFSGKESAQCRISGFTITNGGCTYTGGGICGNGTLATIEYNIIYGNKAQSGWYPSSGYGGGLYDCDGLIQYNIVYDNQAVCDEGAARGGGLYGCDGLISHNIIYNNSAIGFGRHFGGGLSDCQGIIENNTIFGNEAGYGGGLDDCNGIVRNCIIWGNSGDQLYGCGDNVTYSDIEGGYSGTGNIDNDPCFVDTSTGDYHLQSAAGRWNPDTQSWVKDSVTSPCIDAGDPNSDWRRELWPNGRRINMGAYGGTPEASMSLSTACSIADFDNDCDVDYDDLRLFAGKWLVQQVLLAEDLDRNGDVNFMDFAIFGSEYYKENPEPNITYTLGDCGSGLAVMKAADATRFTVTVNGHNMHFEDTMTNIMCCVTRELEMEVYGRQIILSEKVHAGPYPCTCVCDFPIMADLGPFMSGSYTLEVYEVYYNYFYGIPVFYLDIGSTTVTIE